MCTFYVAIMVPYSASFRDLAEMAREISVPECKTVLSDVLVEIFFIVGKSQPDAGLIGMLRTSQEDASKELID